jgi:hypothetical protein
MTKKQKDAAKAKAAKSKSAKSNAPVSNVAVERAAKRVLLVTRLETKGERIANDIDRATSRSERFDKRHAHVSEQLAKLEREQAAHAEKIVELGEKAETCATEIGDKLASFDEQTAKDVARADNISAKKAARVEKLKAQLAKLSD